MVRAQKYNDIRRRLLILLAYTATDCGSNEVLGVFYRKLSTSIPKPKRPDVLIVAGEFNSQVGSFHQSERHR